MLLLDGRGLTGIINRQIRNITCSKRSNRRRESSGSSGLLQNGLFNKINIDSISKSISFFTSEKGLKLVASKKEGLLNIFLRDKFL
jgi:hypothetical protein